MSSAAVDAAITGATIVAQPEVGIPVAVVTHPRAATGLFLLYWALSFVIFGAVLFVVGFTRSLGKLALAFALVLGLAGGYMLFGGGKSPLASATKAE